MVKRNQLPAFTTDQITAMQTSALVVEALRDATPPHPTPEQPATVRGHRVIDELYAQQVSSVIFRSYYPDIAGLHSAMLHRYVGQQEPKPLGTNWNSFRGTPYQPYLDLTTSYVGMAETQTERGPYSRQDRLYLIHEPDTALNGLAVIISCDNKKGMPLNNEQRVAHGLPAVEHASGYHVLSADEASELRSTIESAARSAQQPE